MQQTQSSGRRPSKLVNSIPCLSTLRSETVPSKEEFDLVKYDDLENAYAYLLTRLRKYLDTLDLDEVRFFLGEQESFRDLDWSGCDTPEKVVQQMKSKMHVYKITPVQNLLCSFCDEDGMRECVVMYHEKKEQFLRVTHIAELSLETPDLLSDEYKVQFTWPVTQALVRDETCTLQYIDNLAKKAFGPYYKRLSKVNWCFISESPYWTIKKTFALEGIVWAQKHLHILIEHGVKEVTVGNFKLMHNYCEEFSTTCTAPAATRSMSVTEGIQREGHIERQQLEETCRALRSENNKLQSVIEDLHNDIEDLHRQAQQMRKQLKEKETDDEDTQPDDTCQQKCAKLKQEMEDVGQLYAAMLQIAMKIASAREKILRSRLALAKFQQTFSSDLMSTNYSLLEILTKFFNIPAKKDKMSTTPFFLLKIHLNEFTREFLKLYEQFLNPLLIKNVRDWQQKWKTITSSEGKHTTTSLANLLQSYIASSDAILNPVLLSLLKEDKETATTKYLNERYAEQLIQGKQTWFTSAPDKDTTGMMKHFHGVQEDQETTTDEEQEKAIDKLTIIATSQCKEVLLTARAHDQEPPKLTSIQKVSLQQDQESKEQPHKIELENLQMAKKEIAQLEQKVQQLQRQLSIAEEQPHWVVRREEVELTEEVLGTGSWGVVKVAIFRGLRVAAKVLHNMIISEYNQQLFSREMEIAAKIRHPNLLLFIGATREGEAVILTELMPTSLQKELQKRDITRVQITSIAQDVACALRYLHQWRPSPIIHRDISSANVLLAIEPLPNGWRAKVSDYGSANFMNAVATAAPGSPVYAAPEARYPAQHSPKMDTFSYGVLLVEMCIRRLPEPSPAQREAQILQIQWAAIVSLVRRCTSERPADRPSMGDIMELLASSSSITDQ